MTNAPEPVEHFPPSHRHPTDEWWWRLEAADGTPLRPEAQSQRFPSQADAESWVGEVWQDLQESGVDAVTLFEGDRKVYGPMSLHA